MKINDKNISKKFDELDDIPTGLAFDSEAFWQELHPQIAPQKTRKGFFWAWAMSLVLLLSVSFVFYQNKKQSTNNEHVTKIERKRTATKTTETISTLPIKKTSKYVKHNVTSVENIALIVSKDTVKIKTQKEPVLPQILVVKNTLPKDSINAKAILVKSKVKTPQPRFPMKHQNDFQSKIYEENKADVAKQVFIMQGNDNLESYLNHIKNN